MSYSEALKLAFGKLYSKLNSAQLSAVTAPFGPMLVLAGAGSGKTTVLTSRIYHLINFGNIGSFVPGGNIPESDAERMINYALNGSKEDMESCLEVLSDNPVSPDRVLCITFTNKAAGEFKERLHKMLGDRADEIWAGTFHSICVRILRKHINLLGYSNSFTIYDTEDKKKLIKTVMKENNIDEKVVPEKTVASYISSFKEKRIMPEETAVSAKDTRERTISDIYSDYQKKLKEASAVDFDDLILLTVKLFEEYPDVLEKYREKFDAVLVDEFQDTSPSQNLLVIALAGSKKNVCVVGDDDQSIYSFRGATVENILSFDKAFRDTRIIKLEQNYRSTKNILDAANAVISNNKGRKGKSLWTSGDAGDKLHVRCLYTQAEEAEYICNEIMKLHAYGTPLKDIAVLYRVTAISNSLETAFVKNRLPYKIFGGIRYMERKEIKDIVAYLSVISNTSDSIRLKRIINVPKRSIGDTTVSKIEEIAANYGVDMFEIIKNANYYSELSRSAVKLKEFANLIIELKEFSKTNGISDLITEVIKKTAYDEMLIEENEKEKADLVREFASSGALYEQSAEDASLEGFLADIALVSDTDDMDNDAENVSLMTVHSAKGLEFPVVFIAGFENDVFPSRMAIEEGNDEEERRLCYVAITRAKEKLYITYTKSRMLYGFTSPSAVSMYLDEIPEELTDISEQKPKNTFSSYGDYGTRRSYGDYGLYGNESKTNETKFSEKAGFSSDTARKSKENPFENSFYSAQKQSFKSPAFVKGDKVNHKFFGNGIVLSVEQMGNDALIEVEFESGQTKKLMASFAKLTKL